MSTTMKLSLETKKLLEKRKNYPKEPLEHVVARLLNITQEEDILSPDIIKNIEEGLADIKAGRVYTSEQVKKKMGLK
jgi:predicted transcriptional regulator